MGSSSDAGAKCGSFATTPTANGTDGTSAIYAADGPARYQSWHHEWKLHSATGTAFLPTVVTNNGSSTTIGSTVNGIPADVL